MPALGNIDTAWAGGATHRGFLARLPENWRDLIDDVTWLWGWSDPDWWKSKTMTEILRLNDAATRLGPTRVVRAILVRPVN